MVSFLKSKYFLLTLICISLNLVACSSSEDLNVSESNVDGSGTVVENTETQSKSKFSFFTSKDLDSLVSLELNNLDINPWLEEKVILEVNCKNIEDLLEKYNEKIESEDLENNEQFMLKLSEFSSNELAYIENYKDYQFFTYESTEMKLDDDLKQPFGFTYNLTLPYMNTNLGVVLDRWDESKHYLFGVACGFKSYKYVTETMESDLLKGDVIVRCFSAEELTELLPCDLSLEEQADLIKNNIYFTSGVKVSNKYFRLYQYIYGECNYKFIYNDKEINLNNYESNYALIIKSINREDRTVIIEFTGETLLDKDYVKEI